MSMKPNALVVLRWALAVVFATSLDAHAVVPVGVSSAATLAGMSAAVVGKGADTATANTLTSEERAAGWELLFNGASLDGWRASEPASTFSVRDGAIVVHGPMAHLYYLGPAGQHDYKNFELELDILTYPGSNSGVYFHTEWQPTDWPANGFEVQVNNTQGDPKRTAGLYDVKENYATVAQDNEWFTMRIRVEGKHVVTSVDGKVVTDYTEPDDWTPPEGHPGRRIFHGTFALQGHDRNSEVHYRNIKERALQ